MERTNWKGKEAKGQPEETRTDQHRSPQGNLGLETPKRKQRKTQSQSRSSKEQKERGATLKSGQMTEEVARQKPDESLKKRKALRGGTEYTATITQLAANLEATAEKKANRESFVRIVPGCFFIPMKSFFNN